MAFGEALKNAFNKIGSAQLDSAQPGWQDRVSTGEVQAKRNENIAEKEERKQRRQDRRDLIDWGTSMASGSPSVRDDAIEQYYNGGVPGIGTFAPKPVPGEEEPPTGGTSEPPTGETPPVEQQAPEQKELDTEEARAAQRQREIIDLAREQYPDDPQAAADLATELFLISQGDDYGLEYYGMEPDTFAALTQKYADDADYMNMVSDNALKFRTDADADAYWDYINYMNEMGFDVSDYGDLSDRDAFNAIFDENEQKYKLGNAYAEGDIDSLDAMLGTGWQDIDRMTGTLGRAMANGGIASDIGYSPFSDYRAANAYFAGLADDEDWLSTHSTAGYENMTDSEIFDLALEAAYEDPALFTYLADEILSPTATDMDIKAVNKYNTYRLNQ